MPFATVLELESTIRIELLSDLFCSRKGIPGTIYGINRHAVPEEFLSLGPALIGQANGIFEDVVKDVPINFTAGFTDGAVVNSFGIGPEPTAFSTSEELTRLHVYSFALGSGGNGENEGNKLCKGNLALSGEILRSLFP